MGSWHDCTSRQWKVGVRFLASAPRFPLRRVSRKSRSGCRDWKTRGGKSNVARFTNVSNVYHVVQMFVHGGKTHAFQMLALVHIFQPYGTK